MADPTYFQGGLATGAASTVGGDLFAQGRLLYNNANVVVTADDTTTTLLASDYEDILATGTGILQWFDLGDATTYSVGKRFRFRNASTEIIGIRNSDSTTWRRLPPRWELMCVLTNNGSAAGTWITALRPRITPNAGLFLLDDFMGSSLATSPMGWLTANSGSGSIINTTSAVINVFTGALAAQTGTTTTGYAQMYTRSSLLTTNCVNSFRSWMRTSTISSVTEEFIIRLGFGDSTDMSDHTDGMYFEYDRLTNGDFWSINTAAAGVRTETVTATGIGSSQYYDIILESSSDSSRVDYWINKVHVGTITTNIPGASDSFGVHAGIIKSAGTNNRLYYADFISLGRYPVTER